MLERLHPLLDSDKAEVRSDAPLRFPDVNSFRIVGRTSGMNSNAFCLEGGGILGFLGDVLGALVPSCGPIGPSWGFLGPSWGPLRPLLALLDIKEARDAKLISFFLRFS